MKKVLAMVLFCGLLLCGCSRSDSVQSPVTESKTVYFINFTVLDGNEAAIVRFVGSVNGEYTDTMREETLFIADDALFESFDLRLSFSPSEASIEKMELSQFKDAALLLKDSSPVIYRVEIADGKIYSARSELAFLPASEPADKLCPDCDQWFKEGIEFETHACAPEPSPTPSPTPAPLPVPAGSPGSKACPVCTKWYAEGNDYLYHECVGYSVMCPICSNWHEAGYDFLTHPCAYLIPSPTATPAQSSKPGGNKTNNTSVNSGPGSIQCPVCSNWFAEGDTYLHHECVGYSVMCPVCGKWYDAGYDLLSHPCASGENAPPVVRDRWQCQICGNWYDPGYSHSHSPLPGAVAPTPVPTLRPDQIVCTSCYRTFTVGAEYDNHICPINGGLGPRVCPTCGLSFPGDQLKYHNCQAPPPKVCEGCGESFVGMAYDLHICPVKTQTCPNCGGTYHVGNEYAAHTISCTAPPPPVICTECGESIQPELFADHIVSCPARVLPAPTPVLTPTPTTEPAPHAEQALEPEVEPTATIE